jgi:hypothetical protein
MKRPKDPSQDRDRLYQLLVTSCRRCRECKATDCTHSFLTFCPGDKVMQVENDYDKDVCGDLGVVSSIDMEEGERSVDFDGRASITALASWMSWFWPMRRPSTSARARNTRL